MKIEPLDEIHRQESNYEAAELMFVVCVFNDEARPCQLEARIRMLPVN